MKEKHRCEHCSQPVDVTRYGKVANHKDPRTKLMCNRSGKRVGDQAKKV